jgi:hypothetical protein
VNWETERHRAARASTLAEDLLKDPNFTQAPIDPLAIAAGERPLLIAKGGDLGGLFDGQLEFNRSKGRFLLFFNTKYDHADGRHHPRTRFSIGHELGHFYIAEHRAYLEGGGKSHRSRNEFAADAGIEREADAFAAGLLLPRQLLVPRLRGREITARLLGQVVEEFQASRVASASRCVDVTDQPCALFGIREGRIAWKRVSEMAIRAGCYPRKDQGLRSQGAREVWESFVRGEARDGEKETMLGNWFETYTKVHLHDVLVTEQYLPVPVMGTLLVLITMDEGDVFPERD